MTTQPANYSVSLLTSSLPSTSSVRDVAGDVWLYVSPVLLVVGVCGNFLTLLVLRRKGVAKTSANIYLTAMAVADTSVLLTGLLVEWLARLGVRTDAFARWRCTWGKFLFYSAADVAVWVLVAFTIDRFIAVCFPLRKSKVCRSSRAVSACGAFVACALAKNAHIFWTRVLLTSDGPGAPARCSRPEAYVVFETYARPWIAFVVVIAGPFATILCCNCAIVRSLMHVKRTHCNRSNSSRYLQATAMCLSVSFAFVACLPTSIVLAIGRPYWAGSGATRNASYDVAKNVNNLLVYVNHSINFVLYCLSGRVFRQELVAVLCRPPHCDDDGGCCCCCCCCCCLHHRRRRGPGRDVPNTLPVSRRLWASAGGSLWLKSPSALRSAPLRSAPPAERGAVNPTLAWDCAHDQCSIERSNTSDDRRERQALQRNGSQRQRLSADEAVLEV